MNTHVYFAILELLSRTPVNGEQFILLDEAEEALDRSTIAYREQHVQDIVRIMGPAFFPSDAWCEGVKLVHGDERGTVLVSHVKAELRKAAV